MRAATCGGSPLAGALHHAVALLVFEVVLDLLGGDRPRALRQIAELQLPDRQHAAAVVAEHADVDLAALDILLGDRRGADPLVDEGDALGQRLVALHHRGLGDAHRGVLDQALDDQRQCQPRRPLDLAAHRKHREGRRRHAVVMHELLGRVLAARQHQAARIAAGVGHAQQLEIAHHAVVVDRLAVELLQQVEHHMRLEALDRVADRRQLVLDAERHHLVAAAAQRADHVVFGLPGVDLLLAVALERIRRHQIRMRQHQDAELLHSAIHCRRSGL